MHTDERTLLSYVDVIPAFQIVSQSNKAVIPDGPTKEGQIRNPEKAKKINLSWT